MKTKITALVLTMALLLGGCAAFQANWQKFIVAACENYEVYHSKIAHGVQSLQEVLDLLIVGWPEMQTEAPEFIIAAQIVISALTQALSSMTRVCPTIDDVVVVDAAVAKVQSSPVVQMAKSKARMNLIKRQGKK